MVKSNQQLCLLDAQMLNYELELAVEFRVDNKIIKEPKSIINDSKNQLLLELSK